MFVQISHGGHGVFIGKLLLAETKRWVTPLAAEIHLETGTLKVWGRAQIFGLFLTPIIVNGEVSSS